MTRILVADDDRTTRLLLSETLRAQKYTVVAVEDGATTLKKLKESKFDLALLDVWMPKMNGLEVLAKLRNAKTRPKVIVMTSDDTPQTLLSAIREEAYTYVAKPVDPQALVVLVKETLAKKPGQGSIEVISASPNWVELVVPCSLEEAERIEAFMAHLKTGLSEDVRRAVGTGVPRAAAERRGMGRKARSQSQGADFLFARAPDADVSHRGSRAGLQVQRPGTCRDFARCR